MPVLEGIKSYIGKIVEVALALVALGIVLQVLIGRNIDWIFGDIVANLVDLIGQLGGNGLVGLIAIGIILWLFSKRTVG